MRRETGQRIPLLHDHHNHLSLYAGMTGAIDLQAVPRKVDALARLGQVAGEINLVAGWNDSYYDFTPAELETLAPVVICNLSLHSYLANTAGREYLALQSPQVAAKLTDRVWVEKNLPQVIGALAGMSPLNDRVLGDFLAYMARLGVWQVADMFAAGPALVRALVGSAYLARTEIWTDGESFLALAGDERAKVRGLKIFTDGALGASSAALGAPFRSGGTGLLLHRDEDLLALFRQAADLGQALAIHAIGDLALEQTLRTLTEFGTRGDALPVRLEHCQFITPTLARQAKELGLVLSLQPNFNGDSRQYADRLPLGYAERNNPFRMLIDEVGFVPGEDLLLGSDGMPHGVQAALEGALFPPCPGQRLTLDEFVAGYCLPDFTHGWIEVVVDGGAEQVTTRVVLE